MEEQRRGEEIEDEQDQCFQLSIDLSFSLRLREDREEREMIERMEMNLSLSQQKWDRWNNRQNKTRYGLKNNQPKHHLQPETLSLGLGRLDRSYDRSNRSKIHQIGLIDWDPSGSAGWTSRQVLKCQKVDPGSQISDPSCWLAQHTTKSNDEKAHASSPLSLVLGQPYLGVGV